MHPKFEKLLCHCEKIPLKENSKEAFFWQLSSHAGSYSEGYMGPKTAGKLNWKALETTMIWHQC